MVAYVTIITSKSFNRYVNEIHQCYFQSAEAHQRKLSSYTSSTLIKAT